MCTLLQTLAIEGQLISSLMEKDKFQQVSVEAKSLTVTNEMLSLIPLCQGNGLEGSC